MSQIDQIKQKISERTALVQDIAVKAMSENRGLTTVENQQSTEALKEVKELREWLGQLEETADATAQSEASLRALADQPTIRERAADVRGDKEIAEQFRSAILEKNPAPITAFGRERRGFHQPGLELRSAQEQRTGLMTSSPANSSMGIGFYRTMVMNLVETSPVLRAGATVLETDNGEPMRIPHQTAFSSAGIVTEGSLIPEADPTFAAVTLNAYKYAVLINVTNELVEDSAFDLIGYIAGEAGVSLGLAFGSDILNGAGGGSAPTGVIGQATLGVTGPTGTATGFGSQATAGQGTDLVNSLVGSFAEPYTRSPAFGILTRTHTLTALRNLKGSYGELVGIDYVKNGPAPFYVDPFVPDMGANAKSLIAGDWRRVFVRMVNGIRFETSREYNFGNDQTTFRCILRADSALVDTTGAVKYFQHSAS